MAARAGEERVLRELVEGGLVEKPTGALEAHLAGVPMRLMNNSRDETDAGIAFGPNGL